MRIKTEQYGAVMVVKPDGPVIGDDADNLKSAILETVRNNLGRVVLDTSSVPYVDSRGLESLVEVTEELAHGGKTLKLCALNETVRQIINLTGLSSQFERFVDLNAAVRSFL